MINLPYEDAATRKSCERLPGETATEHDRRLYSLMDEFNAGLQRAREAYDRYSAVTDYKNFQGNPMPAFDELPPIIIKAWVAAANPPPAGTYASSGVSGLFIGSVKIRKA